MDHIKIEIFCFSKDAIKKNEKESLGLGKNIFKTYLIKDLYQNI